MTMPAAKYWKLDDFVDTAIERVLASGLTPAQVVDELAPVRLRPEDSWRVLREGLISILNDRHGMRGVRSGKVQSSRGVLRSVPEESAGLEEYADRVLASLVFEAADGSMRSVLDFSHDDAAAAYGRRVVGPREQAEREEPFWRALMKATKSGKALGSQPGAARRKLAAMAVEARLSKREED